MTENAGRKDRRGSPGLTALTAAMGELERRDRAEVPVRPDRLGVLEIRDETGRTVFQDETEYRAWLDRQGPRGPLARRVSAALRVIRVLREILARLVRRANL